MISLPHLFYEFHKERIISHPGQPILAIPGIEIGPQISREDAFHRVKSGKDVYTKTKEDAYKLAVSVINARINADGPHTPKESSPTGREDVYFRHYHPGDFHPAQGGPGHIFFGERGEKNQKN